MAQLLKIWFDICIFTQTLMTDMLYNHEHFRIGVASRTNSSCQRMQLLHQPQLHRLNRHSNKFKRGNLFPIQTECVNQCKQWVDLHWWQYLPISSLAHQIESHGQPWIVKWMKEGRSCILPQNHGKRLSHNYWKRRWRLMETNLLWMPSGARIRLISPSSFNRSRLKGYQSDCAVKS